MLSFQRKLRTERSNYGKALRKAAAQMEHGDDGEQQFLAAGEEERAEEGEKNEDGSNDGDGRDEEDGSDDESGSDNSSSESDESDVEGLDPVSKYRLAIYLLSDSQLFWHCDILVVPPNV